MFDPMLELLRLAGLGSWVDYMTARVRCPKCSSGQQHYLWIDFGFSYGGVVGSFIELWGQLRKTVVERVYERRAYYG